MASTQINVYENIAAGTTLNFSQNGAEATRVFIVSNLPVGNIYDRQVYAALAKGIPRHADPHPATHPVMGNLQADTIGIAFKDNDPTVAIVTVTYRLLTFLKINISENAPPEVEIGGSVQETQTTMDVGGNPLKLEQTLLIPTDTDYTDPVTGQVYKAGDLVSKKVSKISEATFQQPVFMVRFKRREPRCPFLKSLRYTGKINRGSFLEQPAHSWLVTRITGNTVDGSRSWDVTYEMMWKNSSKGDNWDPLLSLKDRDGQPYAGLIRGAGLRKYQVLEDENFDALNLSIRIR